MKKSLWYSSTSKTFFLLPVDIVFAAGNDTLQDMSRNTISTSEDSLQAYACSQQVAQQHLENQWNESVERSKQAWAQLYRLSELCGRGYDMNNLKKGLLDGLAQQNPSVHQAFEQGKSAVEELLKAVDAGDPVSSEEEKNVFKKIFGQMPGFGDLFSEEELEKAAADPDAWAKKLQEQFITPAEKATLKQREEKLAAEIRESIAAGLRKAGIKPAGEQ